MRCNNIGKFIRWPIGTIIVYGFFRDFIDERISLPLWSWLGVKEGCWFNLALGLASIVLVVLGWRNKRNRYDANHWGIFISIVLLIVVFYLDDLSCSYMSFFGRIPSWVLLISAFWVGLIVHHTVDWTKGYVKKKKDKTTRVSVVPILNDGPLSDLDDDNLAFKSIAQRIAELIISNNPEGSFSIGITGTWGAGKTTMLNFVKTLLEKRDDVIIIEFSPRQSASCQDIQKDFLSLMGESLSRYHSGVQRVTHRYMQAIGALPDELWVVRIIGAMGTQDLTTRRNEIKRVINKVRKKLVILIDDFDRLTGEEILEVFKLIDKNASFPNTFFITAYDKKQTNKVISNNLGSDSPGSVDYTDKYFNLEVPLPIRRQERFINILQNHLYLLSDSKAIAFSKESIDKTLPRLSPFVTTYLPTPRDVKRYVNTIAFSLPPVENDVLLEDFLLLFMLRYKFPEEYVKLGKGEYFVSGRTSTRDTTLAINSLELKSVACSDIVKSLFSTKQATYKSIAHISSFDHYFYDLDSRDLSYREMSELLNPDITIDEFNEIVKPWLTNKRHKSDLIDFVLSQADKVKSLEDTKRYIKLFFTTRTCCDDYDLYIETISYLLKSNVPAYCNRFHISSNNAYIGFFKDALNDMFDFRLSIECIHDALHAANIIDPEQAPAMIFSGKELMSFALAKIDKAVSAIPSGTVEIQDIYRAMRACVDEYNPDPNAGEIIATEAVRKVKSAIQDYPDYFFLFALRHSRVSGSSSIQFQLDEQRIPYKALFKSVEEFRELIIAAKFKSETMKNCISQYAVYCFAQKTWTPILSVNGRINDITQGDYGMYNKLFEGEPVDA